MEPFRKRGGRCILERYWVGERRTKKHRKCGISNGDWDRSWCPEEEKILSVWVSDFGEISTILDGYFLEGIQAAVLKLMNPCYKKDLGQVAISRKKLDKTPLGKRRWRHYWYYEHTKESSFGTTQVSFQYNIFFFMFLYFSY